MRCVSRPSESLHNWICASSDTSNADTCTLSKSGKYDIKLLSIEEDNILCTSPACSVNGNAA